MLWALGADAELLQSEVCGAHEWCDRSGEREASTLSWQHQGEWVITPGRVVSGAGSGNDVCSLSPRATAASHIPQRPQPAFAPPPSLALPLLQSLYITAICHLSYV